jgi:hypothetical protein
MREDKLSDPRNKSEEVQHQLEFAIQHAKKELAIMLTKKKKLILNLGEAFERVVSDKESICEEIKSCLKEEIVNGLISSRLIEHYCLPEWKKKTRPKNEKTSFSQKEKLPMVVDTEGNVNPAPVSSDTESSNSRQQHSQVNPIINEINSSNTESPDCKVHIQKIQELEGTNRELEEALKAQSRLMTGGTYMPVEQRQREYEISIPFRELKIQLIRQSNISGQAEPVLIYVNIDLTSTSNKVKSYTLGKNPELN